ncbi:MAG: HPF/RaiA family ribosome-associated protein [Gammaproteobacteria bacterium]
MQIAIQSRGFSLTDALHQHVLNRLEFTLSRGASRVRRVDVRLSDINGPRGGVDKRCLIEVRLSGLPVVVVQDVQSDMYTAIDRAAGRAARTVLRRLALGNPRRQPHSALVADSWSYEL